jgi:GDP-4-dehydro-6-deoxy-D-mannose reductase
LGRHLADAGDEVVIASPTVDVTDGAAVRQALRDAHPDVIYHLAAQSSVKSSWDAPAETFGVNAMGTVHVLSAVQASSPTTRVLLVSSVEVYGEVPEGDLPITEDTPLRPATPYAASKAAAEMAAIQAHLGWGLDVLRARPFNHTGPGQEPRFFVPNMARQIVEADRSGAGELLTGNLAVARELLDVRDVVRAYRLLAERGLPGEVYNICTGRSIVLDRVVRMLLDLAGSDLKVITDPSRLRPVDLRDLRGDPSRLRQATGWQPEYPLEQTLGDVLDDWRRRTTAAPI